MLYSERFSNQWDVLVNTFIDAMKGRPVEDITLEKVNEWYKVNSFRWSSFSEKEGVLLENEQNNQLRNQMISKIAEFHFYQVQLDAKPAIYPSIGMGVGLAIIVATGLGLFTPLSIFIVIGIAVLSFVLPFIRYASMLDKYNDSQSQKLCHEYAKQLEIVKQELIIICKKFEKQ